MTVKTQKQKQSQIVQVIIGAEILDKVVKKKRKPKKKKVKRKVKSIEDILREDFIDRRYREDIEDLREPYRRSRYMKPLKYKQTFPAYGANNIVMQQTENQRNNRILSDLNQRVNQYERLLKQRPNPINKFIRDIVIKEPQEIKEEDMPEEVVEETERLEEELEEEELKKIEDEIEEQETLREELEERERRLMEERERRMMEQEEEQQKLAEVSKGDDIEEAEQLMKEIEESLKKGRVKKRVEEIEKGVKDQPTPPNEPEELEAGSFGGRAGPLDPVQAVPIPIGEGSNIPEVGIPEDFPPAPAEESKGAEETQEAQTVQFIDIPKPTEFNARYNLLNEVEKAEFMKKFPIFFRSDNKGNLFLRADGSLKAQTIKISEIDKNRFKLDSKELTLKGNKIDEAKKYLLDKLIAKNKAIEREAKKKAKSKVV